MAQQTQINGNRYSFTSITMSADGLDVTKGVLQSINYTATKDPGIVQGNQITVVGLTAGFGQGSGSFEMLVSEWDDFVTGLTNDGALAIMDVDFDVVISYSENDIDVRTDVLRGCRITEVGSNNTKGNDATMKSCNLFVRQLEFNGIAAYADPNS